MLFVCVCICAVISARPQCCHTDDSGAIIFIPRWLKCSLSTCAVNEPIHIKCSVFLCSVLPFMSHPE